MYVGQAIPRDEDRRLLAGRGEFTDDIRLADCAHVVFVRSPHAHARIVSIDVEAALRMPGVLSVLDAKVWKTHDVGADLPLEWEVGFPDGRPMNAVPRPIFAEEKVCHVGVPVAAVVARTRVQAEDAAELIFVDYQVLPAVTDVQAALSRAAPVIHESTGTNAVLEVRLGDNLGVERAMEKSHHITTIDVHANRVTGAPMEPRTCVGEYDSRRDRYTLWSTGQLLNAMRRWLATTFRCRIDQVRVVLPDVGGGFGTRAYYYPEQPVVLLASRLCGCPVRFTASRSEVMMTDHQGREYTSHAQMGFDVNGKITALKVDTIAGVGGYPSTYNAMIIGELFVPLITNIYDIPLACGSMTGVYVNKAPVDAYRGVGEAVTTVCERLLDKAARELAIDPLDLRKRNYIQSHDYPYVVPLGRVYDSGNPIGQHDLLLSLADYDALCKERTRLRANGAIVGLGVAAYTDQSGIGPSRIEKGGDVSGGVGTWEAGRVEVLDNGCAIVSVGTHSHGQGHDTSFRQVAADALGIPIEHITFQQGDSDRVSSNFGTGAQRSLTSAGLALHVAGRRIVAKGKRLAAHLFEVSDLDVEYEEGEYKIAGTDKVLPFAEIARMAYRGASYPEEGFDLGLDETVRYDPGEDTYPTGIHLVMVEIDAETGLVRLGGAFVWLLGGERLRD